MILFLIILGVWLIPFLLNLIFLFISYRLGEDRKVTLEEFWEDIDDISIFIIIPICNIICLIILIGCLIWIPIWEKIKHIEI